MLCRRWAGQVQRAGSKVEGGEEPVQGDARGQEQRAGGTPGDRNKAGFLKKKLIGEDEEEDDEDDDVDSDNLNKSRAGGDGQDDGNDRGVERWSNDDFDNIDDNYNNNEQTTLTKVEMDKMTEMIGELRDD